MVERVFISHLVGCKAFDPSGDQVGRVRDVVVQVRHGGRAPRVLGLVVEVPPRRRVFLPMGRVTGVAVNEVVITGVMNVRRFAQRPDETLVVAELLDHAATIAGGTQAVTVLDVAMDRPANTGDWVVSTVFVRRTTGRLSRGERVLVDWQDVDGLILPDPDQGAAVLLATLRDLRPADLAEGLRGLPDHRRVQVIRGLDDSRLADALEELPEQERITLLATLEPDRAADVLEQMDPDDATDLLQELPEQERARYLDLMEPEEADDVRQLLGYGSYTAGGMMTTVPVILPADATIAEALTRVRNPDLSAALASQVYVVRAPLETPTGAYLGTVHTQRLLRERPASPVSTAVDADLAPIGPETTLAEVTRYFATYDLVAVPVVDSARHLLGAVTVDDVLDHLLPEDWRDSPEGLDPGFAPHAGPPHGSDAPGSVGPTASGDAPGMGSR
ncbi:MAG: CBS domain-containing protein [Actinomycetales bacterium]|nr:CBS domain-containing protein [Actinomycetales bacterium]